MTELFESLQNEVFTPKDLKMIEEQYYSLYKSKNLLEIPSSSESESLAIQILSKKVQKWKSKAKHYKKENTALNQTISKLEKELFQSPPQISTKKRDLQPENWKFQSIITDLSSEIRILKAEGSEKEKEVIKSSRKALEVEKYLERNELDHCLIIQWLEAKHKAGVEEKELRIRELEKKATEMNKEADINMQREEQRREQLKEVIKTKEGMIETLLKIIQQKDKQNIIIP